MLSRTSTLLPNALITSLTGVRAEHLLDAKRIYNPPSALTFQPTSNTGHRPRPKARLRDRHLDRRCAHPCAHSQAAQPQPPKVSCWTTCSALHVHVTCAPALARIRLYVPDCRTASVLVQHARRRVEDVYSAFRLAARQVGARAGVMGCCWMNRHCNKCWWRSVG